MNEAIRHEVSRLRAETGWRISAETGPMHGQVTLTMHDDDLRILVNKVIAAGGITELEREADYWHEANNNAQARLADAKASARAWMHQAHTYEVHLAGRPAPDPADYDDEENDR